MNVIVNSVWKKCYIEKKVNAEVSWCSSKSAEDGAQNQSRFKMI